MLTIENLSVDYYRRGRIIPAVRDLSLSIRPAEAVGLVGESGSGKSTVALAVLRLIRRQEGKILSGRILFKGEDLLSYSSERMRQIRGAKIAMIFQDPFTSLNPVMMIREQMAEVLAAHSLSSSPAVSGRGSTGPPPVAVGDDDLSEALSRVQLDPCRILNSYPHQLSGGQRQRVTIAMALLTRPDLILADEPTTALDVLVQKEILDLLFRLQKDLGMAMLFITHNLSVVAERAAEIAVMKEGRILEQGKPGELFAHPANAYTRELVTAVPRLRRYNPAR